MNFLQKMFHKHVDITEHRLTYCKECGNPFGSIYEALKIRDGYKKTEEKNKVLSRQPQRTNQIRRVMGRNDSSPSRCKPTCFIIECQGKIRCLYCGNIPLKAIQNVMPITHPKVQEIFANWRADAVMVGILK